MVLDNRSEDVLRIGVDLLESTGGAAVENTLGLEAVVFIEIVFGHALSEGVQIGLAELGKNSLSGRTFIFSWETVIRRLSVNKEIRYLQDNSLIDEC